MPRHIHPETVTQFFELHEIPFADKPSFWRKAISPALEMGFRVGESRDDVMTVITPQRHRKLYKGFGGSQYKMGIALAHAMFSNRIH